jgi:hypothetical protein
VDVVYDEMHSNRKPTTMPPSEKTKEATPKKTPAVESKVVEAATKAETSKPETSKAEASKPETPAEAKPDAAAKKQGMGEGQKPVTQAYKDNWNAIFGDKKKKR